MSGATRLSAGSRRSEAAALRKPTAAEEAAAHRIGSVVKGHAVRQRALGREQQQQRVRSRAAARLQAQLRGMLCRNRHRQTQVEVLRRSRAADVALPPRKQEPAAVVALLMLWLRKVATCTC